MFEGLFYFESSRYIRPASVRATLFFIGGLLPSELGLSPNSFLKAAMLPTVSDSMFIF